MPGDHSTSTVHGGADTSNHAQLEVPPSTPLSVNNDTWSGRPVAISTPAVSAPTHPVPFQDVSKTADAIAPPADTDDFVGTSSNNPDPPGSPQGANYREDIPGIHGHEIDSSRETHDQTTLREQQEEHERPDSPDTPRLHILRSIGKWNCVVLFGGTLITLLSLGYLVFLWAGEGPVAGGEEATHPWRTIMLGGWATQSVTLTSLLIRVICAAQGGVCTSLIAAIFIERQIPLSLAARFSITRAVSGEPPSLLQAIVSSKQRTIFIRLEAFLLFIIALTTLLLQFSSTILISDFDTLPLVEYANRTLISLALSPKSDEFIGSFLAVGDLDSTMALFGEMESSSDPSPDDHGVSSTGIKRRAFLPYQKSARSRLQLYKGAAFTLHTEVSCMKPKLSGRLYLDQYWPSIEGSIDYDQTYAGATVNPTKICYKSKESKIDYCLPKTFGCTVPYPNKFETMPSWPTALCHLPIRVNETDSNHYVPAWDQHTDPLDFTSGSWPLLVFATNLQQSFWRGLKGSFEMPDPVPYGEWNSYEITQGGFFNVSLCFSGLNTTVSDLTMKGKVSQSEPDIQWNSTTNKLEVDALQLLLGADVAKKNISQRDVLTIVDGIHRPDLASLDINPSLAGDVIAASEQTFGAGTAANVVNTADNSSIPVCAHCDLFGPGISSDIATVFEQIVATTSRAAVAVDAYLLMLTRSWYNSLLPKFDVKGYVTSSFSTDVLLPVHWNGLTTVIVLVAINTLTVWIVTTLYVRRSRYTMIGNIWQAASQLTSKTTIHVLERGYNVRDEEIHRLLEQEDFLVKVSRSSDDGREHLQRV